MIILKARREGVSTFTEALLTAICVFQDYTQALVVAHLKQPAERIWQMSERFVRSSPLEGVADIKRRAISFRHSTLELATAGTPEAARSADLTCLHASELAFWKQASALLAIRQCLPQDEESFFLEVDESTANGIVDTGAMFHDEWMAAVAGDSSFLPVFLPWHTFPQYTSRLLAPLDDLDSDEEALMADLALTWGQIRWRRRVIADRCQGDIEKFNQEYPSTPEMAFIMSGLPFFRQADLVWIEPMIEVGRRGRLVEARGRVRFLDDVRGPLRVFRPPLPGREYVIGADSSMGIQDQSGEHSRSAAEVLDMGTLEQVAEYDEAAPPHVFAKDLALLGRAYNDALLAPEVQASGGGGGREIIVYLRDQYAYPNLHRWTAPDRIKAGQPVLYGWECVDPSSRILTSDLRWTEAHTLEVGDQILGCQERVTGGKGSAIHVRIQTIKSRQVFPAPRCKVVLANGETTCVSTNHPFLVFRQSRKDVGWQWMEASRLRQGDLLRYLPMWESLRTYEAGRLSAFLDGEGHLSRGGDRGGYQLLITQVEGLLADEIADLWGKCGFDAIFKWMRHKDRPQEQTIQTTGVLRVVEVLRALGSLRPTRLLRRFAAFAEAGYLTLRSFERMPVDSIIPLPDGEVIGLTTDPDHTLIADGLVGHNTNVRTRPRMLARIQEVILEKRVALHSRALVRQLRTFGESDSGKLEALAGHDDLLFAFGIALMSRSENYVVKRGVPLHAAPAFPWAQAGLDHTPDPEDRDRTVLSDLLLAYGTQPLTYPTEFLQW
jgi:hypothetical protein